MRKWLSGAVAMVAALVVLGGPELDRAGAAEPVPEGRAYELVSPVDKGDNDAEPGELLGFAGVSGEREGEVAFSTFNGLPGSEGGPLNNANVAVRGADGWTTTSIVPPNLSQSGTASGLPVLLAADLDAALVPSKADLTGTAGPGVKLYVRRLGSPSFSLATSVGGGEFSYPPESGVGASTDFSRVFFRSDSQLTAGSPATSYPYSNLYEWHEGAVSNVGVLPGEISPAAEGVVSFRPRLRPVSADGKRVVFAAPVGGVVQLFLREGGNTVEVSRPENGVTDPAGPQPATFVGAAADGSSVFFTSTALLTADAFTGEPGRAPNLYRYDVATGTLADLTVDRADPEGAAVGAALVAADGGAAYFVAGGVLADGATLGAPNLYRWGAGEGIAFVATVSSADPLVYSQESPGAVVNPSGTAIAFTSSAGLAGHPDAAGISEIYHYSVATGTACASCAAEIGTGATIEPTAILNIATGTTHPLSADGTKVFFATADPLVPADVDGLLDTYVWEGGVARLISPGDGDSDSRFVDADPSGTDVYFATRDRLLPADRDENSDVYDARVGGGFAETPAPLPCSGETCRPAVPAPPAAPQLDTRGPGGPGNATAKPPRKHRKHKHRAHRKRGKPNCKAHGRKCHRASNQGHRAGKRG